MHHTHLMHYYQTHKYNGLPVIHIPHPKPPSSTTIHKIPRSPLSFLHHILFDNSSSPVLSHIPRKDLHYSITTRTNHPSIIFSPRYSAYTLTTHQSVGGNLLNASPFLETPEAKGGVVAGGDEFATIVRQGQSGDGGGMGEHIIGALAWKS